MSAAAERSAGRRSGLTGGELMVFHAANGLVAGSGVALALLRYLVPSDDPFAVVNHPWEPFAQHAHVVLAPLLVFALGMVWRAHVVASWSQPGRPHRASGAALALTALPMVLSGVLIQAAVAPFWRSFWVAVHLAAAALWLVTLVAHRVGRDNGDAAGDIATGGRRDA